MRTYKITNITGYKGKKDFKYNSELQFDYVDGMTKKTINIRPGESTYLITQNLPLSIHRLRMKGLVTVSTVSPNQLSDLLKKEDGMEDTPKSVKKETPVKKAEIIVDEISDIEPLQADEEINESKKKKTYKKSQKAGDLSDNELDTDF